MQTLNMTRKPKRNPSFFKILIGNFDKKLRIPPAFVKYVFKGNVPTMLTLYSDSGNSWRVRIKVEQGSYFFNNGWSKFVKYHDLEIGDFLVFFLVDSSTFDVFIYNRTACAKNINLAAKKRKGRSPRVSRQIEQTPSHKCTSTSKKPRTVPRAQEVEFVSGITPKNVSYVMIVKGYNKYYAGIPRCFTEEAGLGKVSMVMIRGPKGGMWPMMTTFSSKQVLLRVGWSKFLHENEIVIGDTLLFEHVPNTGHLIHVHVVNKDGTGNCGSLAGKRPRDRPREQTELPPSTNYASSSKRTKGVSELILEHASFVVVLKKYHQYSVSVPASFAKETSLAEEPSTVIKDSEGRKWELNILVDAKSNVRLGAGWSQFVLENKLEAGDTISFQHIPNTGNVIYFKIISKARAANYDDGRNMRKNVC